MPQGIRTWRASLEASPGPRAKCNRPGHRRFQNSTLDTSRSVKAKTMLLCSALVTEHAAHATKNPFGAG